MRVQTSGTDRCCLRFPHNSLQIAETALIATVGGVGFYLIGFPGGLVSGSMLAVAVAALAGRPMKIPVPMARLCFILVGILLGAVVTPDTLKGIAAWPLSVALLVIAAICMMTATAFYLRLVHGWDPLSALLGASPGSMAQVMALSAEFKADVRGIAIVHVMRVLLIVLGLPAGLALFGSTVEPVVSTRGLSESSLLELVTLVTVSTIVALAMLRVRFPGGLLFGAMAGSAFLHGMDLVRVSLPWWAGGAAVLTLGAVAGARSREYESPNAVELSRGGLWLVRSGGRRGCGIRADCGGLPSISDCRRHCRFRTGRAGHDDGARPCSTPRPCLRRGASSSPIPGRELFSGYRGPAPRAQAASTAAPELETAGTGDI